MNDTSAAAATHVAVTRYHLHDRPVMSEPLPLAEAEALAADFRRDVPDGDAWVAVAPTLGDYAREVDDLWAARRDSGVPFLRGAA